MLKANTLIFFSLLSALAVTACDQDASNKQATGTTSTAAAKTDNDAVATVNGKPIEKDMFDVYFQQRVAARPKDPTAMDQEAAVQDVVSREILYQEAIDKGLAKKPDVVAELENSERNILANALLRDQVAANKLTDDMLKKDYTETAKKMDPQEYKAKHIMVKTEEESKNIIEQLDAGVDFTILANKSLDKKSAKKGGDLGWFQPSQMTNPFSDAMKSMDKGTYTKTPVKTEYGYHVIFLEDKRDVVVPTFDKVKETVRASLQSKLANEYVESLKAKAKVEVKPIPLPMPVIPEVTPTPATAPGK